MVAGTIPRGAALVYVSFSAEMNVNTTEALIAVMMQCVTAGVKEVRLLLSTPGGLVLNGLNVYNVLKGMPFDLVTHNVGNVDSIGNVVFLGAKKRYASPHATFMFHGVGFDVSGNVRLEEKSLRERLDSLMSDQKRIGAVIAENSKLTADEIGHLFLEQQTKDAAWAVEKGIVDEIREVQIPPGVPVVSLVFQRQSR